MAGPPVQRVGAGGTAQRVVPGTPRIVAAPSAPANSKAERAAIPAAGRRLVRSTTMTRARRPNKTQSAIGGDGIEPPTPCV